MNDALVPLRRPSLTIRLTPEEKRRFAALAAIRRQSESELGLAIIRQLLKVNDVRPPLSVAPFHKEPASDRITIRLRPGDRCTIAERARLRGALPSTYLAALVRAHLVANPPLTANELATFKQAVIVLAGFGRVLALLAKSGGQQGSPPRDLQRDLNHARAIVAALEQRMHEFVRAALISWESRSG